MCSAVIYCLHSKKVGTLDWARLFLADASSTSRANEGPALPWALAELTRHRPFVDTGFLVVIRRKLPSDQVIADCSKVYLLL